MAVVIPLLLCAMILGAAVMKGWRNGPFFLLACLCFLVMFLCFYIYSVKNMVFSADQRRLIYGPVPVERFFRDLVVTRQAHAAVYCVSRSAVPAALFLDAVHKNYQCRRLFARRPWLYAVCLVPAAATMVLTLPGAAYRLLSYRYHLQTLVSVLTYGVLLVYLLAALVLQGWEYVPQPSGWYRKCCLFTLVGTAVFAAEYAFFALLDPALIFQDLSRIFVDLPFLRLYHTQSTRTWVTVLSLCVVSTAVMLVYIWLASKVVYDREKLEMRITLRSQSDPVTTALIIHGTKNLILQSKILSGQLCGALEAATPDLEQARSYAEQMRDIHMKLYQKMNDLYASFQSKGLTLVQTPASSVLDMLMARAAAQHPDLQCRDSTCGGKLLCDRELLAEAIYNVIVNAYEAVPPSRTAVVRLTAERVRSAIVFSVRDNGRGIPPDMGCRVFLPFITSKSTADSWGLGLCYARQIIKKHMGEITFESDSGGTTFFISIPQCGKE